MYTHTMTIGTVYAVTMHGDLDREYRNTATGAVTRLTVHSELVGRVVYVTRRFNGVVDLHQGYIIHMRSALRMMPGYVTSREQAEQMAMTIGEQRIMYEEATP